MQKPKGWAPRSRQHFHALLVQALKRVIIKGQQATGIFFKGNGVGTMLDCVSHVEIVSFKAEQTT